MKTLMIILSATLGYVLAFILLVSILDHINAPKDLHTIAVIIYLGLPIGLLFKSYT